MAGDVTHSPETIQTTLAVLVEKDGNADAAARQLKAEGEVTPNASTIRRWRDEYSEMYADIEKRLSKIKEDELVAMLRTRAHRSAEVVEELLERASRITNPKDVPNAVRAVADVQNKSIDALMKMTGRAPSEGGSPALESLIAGMQASGYLKVNVSMETKPKFVESTVVDESNVLPTEKV